ncbi:ArgE/DapE family deacylase [Oricola thermophila]|uniref:Probable succinyl-diaminopimelate desuccinylase n=2 Tax=Oricola thermophila TaxID=2742145 RepID=A0A6N1VIQ2_9HYPH|nr:ArgE/DapE family deacylase [Oricola thermophila]QKV20634.1 ArgE/DapE family deacylase [Oricola thermophila]
METAICKYVEEHRDDAVSMLAELVRTPSDNPPGDCAAHAERTAELLEAAGLTVERHPVPDEVVKRHGMISATNLIVRHRFGDGPVLALNAHGDVVPPGSGWSTDPYGGEIRDGWMYGRGAAVSKSDIASYAFAMKALIETGAKLDGTVELHVTYDEEIGGHTGPGYILSQGLSKPDYAVCAAFSYAVVTAHNGCLHLEARIKGKSAHAAMPTTGHDAIAALGQVIGAIYDYGDSLTQRKSTFDGIDHPTCIVGLVNGGINTNVVADGATLRIDRRITPDEDADAVEAELREVLAECASRLDGISIEVERILLARPFKPVEGADFLADSIAKRACQVLGESVGTTAVPLYTDARHYSEQGIPTVMYGAGPRTLIEANGHRADERLPLDTLAVSSKVIALAACDLLRAR